MGRLADLVMQVQQRQQLAQALIRRLGRSQKSQQRVLLLVQSLARQKLPGCRMASLL